MALKKHKVLVSKEFRGKAYEKGKSYELTRKEYQHLLAAGAFKEIADNKKK